MPNYLKRIKRKVKIGRHMSMKLSDRIKDYEKAYELLKDFINTPTWAALSDENKDSFWNNATRQVRHVNPPEVGSVWRCKFDKDLVIIIVDRVEYSKLNLVDAKKQSFGPKTVAESLDYFVGYESLCVYYKSIKDQSVDTLRPDLYEDFRKIFDEITDEGELGMIHLNALEE